MRTLRPVLIVLATLLVASACGDGDDDPASETVIETSASAVDEPAPSGSVAGADDTEAEPAADPNAVVASFRGDDLTVGELEAMTLELTVGDTAALSNWLFLGAIEQVLADRGRPVTADDIAAAGTQTGVPDPDSPLVRATAVSNVVFAFAEEQTASTDSDAAPPEVLCSSHILLDTEAEAAEVAALAQAGGDFAELAMTYSTGPSGPTGGQLGCTPTASFVPEFGDGARANGVGITGPVQSSFGWHVIQVRSIGPGDLETHPELTPADVDAFRQQQAGERLDAFVDEIVVEASALVAAGAEIDPAYGVWDEAIAQVVG
ncbi:MAG: peptidylprolyl isomerase [Actinomycetota bacterium]